MMGDNLQPVASVIIPWCNRPEIELTLPHTIERFREQDCEIIIVNCGGDDVALASILERLHVVGSNVSTLYVPSTEFNKSLALNLGAFVSRAEILLTLDADIILLSDIIAAALFLTERCFITIAQVRETKLATDFRWPEGMIDGSHLIGVVSTWTTEFLWSDGRSTTVQNWRSSYPNHTRAGPGLVLVRKQHFLDVQGYDSRFHAWGFADIDLHVRLQYALGLEHIQTGAAEHLSHTDAQRNLKGRTRHVSSQLNFAAACKRYSRCEFEGTYELDTSTWKD
ncbi:MAG: glycosyltransferase family 2 protein, partial [Acidobacteriaceae bacterium]|nr:glycosyltransferase family 2 protein [Acidobacteriaceae bacterium]